MSAVTGFSGCVSRESAAYPFPRALTFLPTLAHWWPTPALRMKIAGWPPAGAARFVVLSPWWALMPRCLPAFCPLSESDLAIAARWGGRACRRLPSHHVSLISTTTHHAPATRDGDDARDFSVAMPAPSAVLAGVIGADDECFKANPDARCPTGRERGRCPPGRRSDLAGVAALILDRRWLS